MEVEVVVAALIDEYSSRGEEQSRLVSHSLLSPELACDWLVFLPIPHQQ
jgi:hypothetical protein